MIKILYLLSSRLDIFSDDTRDLLADCSYVEFDQLPGELLIIPTGWLHQVKMAADCMY